MKSDDWKGFVEEHYKYRGDEKPSFHVVLAEVRTDVNLAIKLSKYVHDNCKDVPHDIGLKLVQIVSEHFN